MPKRRGQLVWTGAAFSARVGRGAKLVPLHTADRSLAEVRLQALCAGCAAPESTEERFAEAVDRICNFLDQNGMVTVEERRSRLRRYALPSLGALTVKSITPQQISSLLVAAAKTGLSQQTVRHLQVDLCKVFAELVRDGVIITNPASAERVRVPKIARDKRKRVLLTDEEFARFFAYCWRNEAPKLPRHRFESASRYQSRLDHAAARGVSRRQLGLMSLVSRAFGGLRPSDLHAWTWEDVDILEWTWADAPRPKTEHHDNSERARERIRLPAPVVAALRVWWEGLGGPTGGLVFERQRPSYARELRSALWDAGVTRPELHEDSEHTKRTDFYSFRRAFVTAIAAAGTNAQTAMRLTGHRSMTTHQRYNVPTLLEIPNVALPKMKAPELLPGLSPALPGPALPRSAMPRPAVRDEDNTAFDEALANFDPTADFQRTT